MGVRAVSQGLPEQLFQSRDVVSITQRGYLLFGGVCGLFCALGSLDAGMGLLPAGFGDGSDALGVVPPAPVSCLRRACSPCAACSTSLYSGAAASWAALFAAVSASGYFCCLSSATARLSQVTGSLSGLSSAVFRRLGSAAVQLFKCASTVPSEE